MTILKFKKEKIKIEDRKERVCRAEKDLSKRTSNTWSGCPVHGLEGYGGIDNRIIVMIQNQVKYFGRTHTNLPDVMLAGTRVGVCRDDNVWLAYEKGEAHKVTLIRDGVSVTFNDFANFGKASNFADRLKSSAEICERAFNTKLAEDIKADADAKYNVHYSNFLCNAIRDTQAMSDEDAIKECLQLIEIIKTRSQPEEK